MHKTSARQKVYLVIFGLFLSIVLIEAGLRIAGSIFLNLQEKRNTISVRQKGTYRIICLGDSLTFGAGVASEQSYSSQLEKILNQRCKGIRFSVINRGVPGMTSEMILMQLEVNLNKYRPNMVIAMMGANDSNDYSEYRNTPVFRILHFFQSFRTYKLTKFLQVYIINKVQDISISIHPVQSKKTTTMMAYGTDIKSASSEYDKYTELAQSFLAHNDYVQSEEMFKKAIELEPREAWLYEKLARCYVEQGKFKEAEEFSKKSIELNPNRIRSYVFLAFCYAAKGRDDISRQYKVKADNLRSKMYKSVTRVNYNRLKDILIKKNIRFVCVQYPTLKLVSLKNMFDLGDHIIFVDNGKIFKDAILKGKYSDYFIDRFGGDWGHCTAKGNSLLAENIADAILGHYELK